MDEFTQCDFVGYLRGLQQALVQHPEVSEQVLRMVATWPEGSTEYLQRRFWPEGDGK